MTHSPLSNKYTTMIGNLYNSENSETWMVKDHQRSMGSPSSSGYQSLSSSPTNSSSSLSCFDSSYDESTTLFNELFCKSPDQTTEYYYEVQDDSESKMDSAYVSDAPSPSLGLNSPISFSTQTPIKLSPQPQTHETLYLDHSKFKAAYSSTHPHPPTNCPEPPHQQCFPIIDNNYLLHTSNKADQMNFLGPLPTTLNKDMNPLQAEFGTYEYAESKSPKSKRRKTRQSRENNKESSRKCRLKNKVKEAQLNDEIKRLTFDNCLKLGGVRMTFYKMRDCNPKIFPYQSFEEFLQLKYPNAFKH